MKFSKKGAVLGFIAGATGGAVASFSDFSFVKGTLLAAVTAFLVALLVSFLWNLKS